MIKLNGISLLLISIGITSLATILKLVGLITISEILLWVGMLTCVVALGMIVYHIAREKRH